MHHSLWVVQFELHWAQFGILTIYACQELFNLFCWCPFEKFSLLQFLDQGQLLEKNWGYINYIWKTSAVYILFTLSNLLPILSFFLWMKWAVAIVRRSILWDGVISLVILANGRRKAQNLSSCSPSVSPKPLSLLGLNRTWQSPECPYEWKIPTASFKPSRSSCFPSFWKISKLWSLMGLIC